MDTHTVSGLEAFSDWIRTTDAHAAYHLSLLEKARRVLEGTQPATAVQRTELADRLERWRYQLLGELQGQFREEDLRLAETLDLAANRLAGRPARPPRSVRQALQDDSLDTDSFQEALAALDRRFPLDRLMEQARELTEKHFSLPAGNGTSRPKRRMFLYAPLYLSNYCINHCLYCGFRYPEPIPRRQLSAQEALQETEVLYRWGFRHVLLVAGDFPSRTSTRYVADIVHQLVSRGFQTAVEIAPQTTAEYAELRSAGVSGVTLYQETYQEHWYSQYHPRGSKTFYDWRLEGLERAAEAGIGRLGLGILLGLAPPDQDLRAMLRHAQYLQHRFPDRIVAFSLPRIHDAPRSFQIPYPVSDEELIRFYCVLRLAFPKAELVLSTREPADLRNRLAQICITQMSAGSSTAPGGYREKIAAIPNPAEPSSASSPEQDALLPGSALPAAPEVSETPPAMPGAPRLQRRPGEQFPVADHRTLDEVADWLHSQGFAIVWRGEEPAGFGGHCLDR